MAISYCPTSRTFYRLRSVLMRELALERHAVRPSLALANLVPENRRRQVWQELRQEGLRLPALRVSRSLHWASVAHVLHMAIEVSAWCGNVLGMLVAVPLGLIDYMITRRWAVHVDPCGPVTVREAGFYLTSYREQLEARHGSSNLRDAIRAGYRPRRQEIELRVRLLVAASLQVPLEQVTRESRF
jgi:hypothetical protein